MSIFENPPCGFIVFLLSAPSIIANGYPVSKQIAYPEKKHTYDSIDITDMAFLDEMINRGNDDKAERNQQEFEKHDEGKTLLESESNNTHDPERIALVDKWDKMSQSGNESDDFLEPTIFFETSQEKEDSDMLPPPGYEEV